MAAALVTITKIEDGGQSSFRSFRSFRSEVAAVTSAMSNEVYILGELATEAVGEERALILPRAAPPPVPLLLLLLVLLCGVGGAAGYIVATTPNAA